MKYWLIIINDFIHDLSTGLWASSLLTIFLIEKKLNYIRGSPAALSIQEIKMVFFWLGLSSVVIIAVTGVFRYLSYKTEENNNRYIKNRALIIKHIILGTIFLIGTYIAYKYTFY